MQTPGRDSSRGSPRATPDAALEAPFQEGLDDPRPKGLDAPSQEGLDDPPHDLEGERFQTGGVVLVSSAHFVHDVYSSFLAPLLPLLIERLGIGYLLAGVLAVVQRLPAALNPIVGLWADRIQLRFLLALGPVLTAVSMSLLGVAPSYGVLLLLLATMGVGATCFHVPGPVLIRALSGRRMGQGMGFYMVGGELARTVGPLVILGAVTLWGLEGTWRLMPLGVVASGLLYVRLRRLEVRGDHRVRRADAGARRRRSSLASVGETLRPLGPFLLGLTGFTIFRSFLKSALVVFLPVYLTGRGESLWFAGGALSVLELSGAAGTLVGGAVSDRVGRRALLLTSTVVSGGLGWLLLGAEGIWAFGLLVALGFFLFASSPVLLARVQEAGKERPAFLNGLYMSLSFLASSLSALALGWAADRFGLRAAFRAAVLLSLVALPFLAWLAPSSHGASAA